MKTKEELNALKEKVEPLNNKLNALTDGELAQVSGGVDATQDDTQGKRKGQALIRESVGE